MGDRPAVQGVDGQRRSRFGGIGFGYRRSGDVPMGRMWTPRSAPRSRASGPFSSAPPSAAGTPVGWWPARSRARSTGGAHRSRGQPDATRGLAVGAAGSSSWPPPPLLSSCWCRPSKGRRPLAVPVRVCRRRASARPAVVLHPALPGGSREQIAGTETAAGWARTVGRRAGPPPPSARVRPHRPHRRRRSRAETPFTPAATPSPRASAASTPVPRRAPEGRTGSDRPHRRRGGRQTG